MLWFCMRWQCKEEVTIEHMREVRPRSLLEPKCLISEFSKLSAFHCYSGRILASYPEMSLSPNLVSIFPPCSIVEHILLYDITIWLNVKRHCVT